MDWIKSRENCLAHLKKYPYVYLILVLGLILLLLPEKQEQTVSREPEQASSRENVQEALTRVLSLVEGAGKVNVVLTEKTGEEKVYQTDESVVTGGDTAQRQRKTVMGTDELRQETGLIRQINPPSFLGAVVLCQGADDPKVKLAMVEAVMRATGLPSNCISVLKMK